MTMPSRIRKPCRRWMMCSVFWNSQPYVGKTISMTDFIKRMNQSMNNDDPGSFQDSRKPRSGIAVPAAVFDVGRAGRFRFVCRLRLPLGQCYGLFENGQQRLYRIPDRQAQRLCGNQVRRQRAFQRRRQRTADRSAQRSHGARQDTQHPANRRGGVRHFRPGVPLPRRRVPGSRAAADCRDRQFRRDRLERHPA